MKKITDLFQPKCQHRHTAKTHPNCFDENGKPRLVHLAEPAKVLIFDIETLPIVAYVWGVWQENIPAARIIKDWCVLSWSAKWLDDDKIMSDVLTSKEAKERNDKRLVSSFWKLLEEADVVVTQNGKKFDIKKMNTRFWKHKLGRPSSYKVIDTLTAAKSAFGLTFNGQDFMAEFLDIQQKLHTDFQLWAACDRGESVALKYMLDYNEHDVRMLEQIYLEMREWIPNHPNLDLYAKIGNVCPVCLQNDFSEIGVYSTNTRQYREYRCKCDAIWHDTKMIKE